MMQQNRGSTMIRGVRMTGIAAPGEHIPMSGRAHPGHHHGSNLLLLQRGRRRLQGVLLQDAGLDSYERNLILTALKDDFSVERVAQELRNQWPDHDLKHKDQSGRSTAWSVDAYEEDDEASLVDKQGPDFNFLVHAGLNDEGLSIMEETELEAQEALALMDQGRKTLREARAKQHQVKMSRQYYKSDRMSIHQALICCKEHNIVGQHQVFELRCHGTQSGSMPQACTLPTG